MQPIAIDKAAGAGLMLLASLSFGLGPTLASLAYSGGASVTAVLLFRAAFALIVVWLLIRLQGRSVSHQRPSFLASAALGLLATGVSYGYLGAVEYVPVSIATLLFFTYPIFTAIFDRESRSRSGLRLWLCMALAFIGLALALGVKVTGADWRGIALAFSAALCMTGTILLSRKLLGVSSSNIVLFWNLIAMLLILGAVSLWLPPALPAGTEGWLGFLGMAAAFVIGYCAFLAGVARLGAAPASLINNAEPVISIVAAALILGQTLGRMEQLGVTIVLGAIAFHQYATIRAARSGSPSPQGGEHSLPGSRPKGRRSSP